MSALAILLWDGFLIIGEGFGLQLGRARRFADVAWLASVGTAGVWLVAMLAWGVQA